MAFVVLLEIPGESPPHLTNENSYESSGNMEFVPMRWKFLGINPNSQSNSIRKRFPPD
jgi:hypothetical protein